MIKGWGNESMLKPDYSILNFYKVLIDMEKSLGKKEYLKTLKKIQEIIDDEVKAQERNEVK